MRTHCLETRDFLRASVLAVELLEATPTKLVAKTHAVQAAKKAISSANSDMVNQQKLAPVGQAVAGRLQVDVISDHVLRVRYAEGDTVPVNATPMLLPLPPPPTGTKLRLNADTASSALSQQAPWLPAAPDTGAAAGTVELTTATLVIRLHLKPYRLEILARDGRRLCGVGGPEKDNFSNWDSVNTGICRALADGGPVAMESFDLQHDEAIFGLGEHFIKLNKVGQTIDLNMTDALGVTTPRAYKNIPFYLSTQGYGVFFNHSSLMTYWVGSQSACDVQVAAEDDFLDYFIITGSIPELLARYTELTGKGSMPPRWSFGYWQSKISYKAADETLEIARQLRAHQVPCDVIHLDTHWFKADWYCDLTFDAARFPDPAAYLKELAGLGIKISLWQLPYIPEGSPLYADLLAVQGFVKNQDGGVYNCGICFTPGFKGTVGVVDYSNPAAVRVHQEYFRRLFRLGAKVIKTDFGEAAPLDGVYHDGTPGHRMHNLYPLLYNRALAEVTAQETGDAVVWARSAWAGNQRYPLHWGGDNSPNYHNMVPQLEGGLSFGLSGFQFWSQDIGGFCGAINDRLLIRWMQLGMFLSHSRIHGFGDREVYKFAPETLRLCRQYIQLRYQLLPYIFATAEDCVARSVPMARALVVEYQDDPTTWNIGDEYLFGDSLLVAPICTEGTQRRVYLPAGVWTDWWSKERLTGPQWLTVDAPLDRIPLYVREGGLIPMTAWQPYVDAAPTTELKVLVAPFEKKGETRLSIPVNGTHVALYYRAVAGRHTVTIGPSAGIAITVEALDGRKLKVVQQ